MLPGNRIVGGVGCDEVLAQLPDFVDGVLADGPRLAIEAHLVDCPNCARFGGEYGALVARLRGELSPAAPLAAPVAERLRRAVTAS
jgi:anti-sigma factor RsiW